MKKFVVLWLLTIMSTNGCTETQDIFVVNEKKFKLIDNEGQCQLQDYDAKEKFDLFIPWPCQVHKSPKGVVRVHEESGKHYFIIESSRPHRELPNDCETQLQSIMLYSGSVTPSEFSDLVASCRPFQWDIKVFTGLFH